MHLRRTAEGFTLIEATVAVALLALGCLAVTGVLAVSLRAEAAELSRGEARALLDREAERLRVLPFFRARTSPDVGPRSLLSDVFPHADPSLDTTSSWFGGAGGEAVFVSERQAGGFALVRTACFVHETQEAYEPLREADVQGWAVWEADRPPALALTLRLELVDERGARMVRDFVLTALRSEAEAAP